MNKISKKGLTRRAWLEARKSGIGGSDVAAILEIDQYRSPYQVWCDKVGQETEEIDNEFIRFGNLLEPVIRKEYKRRTGFAVRQDHNIRISEQRPHLICNVDGLVTDSNREGIGVLECKNMGTYRFQKMETEVPMEYFCQIQHNMYVTGLKWADFAILIGGNQLRIIPVEFDPEYVEKQNEHLDTFWNEYVVPRVPPPMIASDVEVMKPIAESCIDANEEIVELCETALSLKSKQSEIEASLKEVSDKIKTHIGTNEALVFDGKVLATWKAVKQNPKFDEAKFKAEQKEIYEKYLAPPKNAVRMFLLKSQKEKEGK